MIENIKIRKGMSKEEVNKKIETLKISLKDDTYLGKEYKHIWICKCGNEFTRWWNTIRRGSVSCVKCSRQQMAKNIANRLKPEDSFAQYHIDNTDPKFLEKYWDWEKNNGLGIDPWNIYPFSQKEIWIKCQNKEINQFNGLMKKEYHDSYKTCGEKFSSGRRCPYCHQNGIVENIKYFDSFAYWCENKIGKDFIEKYWGIENTKHPSQLTCKSEEDIWIKCQENSNHKTYLTKVKNFTLGHRCPYCVGQKVHPLDSFGYHNFEKVMSWHPDNDISPFKVSRASGKEYKFICETCGLVFNKRIYSAHSWCPSCSKSRGERKISEYLDRNNISYIYDQPYFKDLISDRGNPLRPDFILEEEKIWIEYDGEFHYKDMTGNLKTQQHHDKLKDEYAKEHGYKMIRIPYWEFDNIENILLKEVFLI